MRPIKDEYRSYAKKRENVIRGLDNMVASDTIYEPEPGVWVKIIRATSEPLQPRDPLPAAALYASGRARARGLR